MFSLKIECKLDLSIPYFSNFIKRQNLFPREKFMKEINGWVFRCYEKN